MGMLLVSSNRELVAMLKHGVLLFTPKRILPQTVGSMAGGSTMLGMRALRVCFFYQPFPHGAKMASQALSVTSASIVRGTG